MTGEHSAHNTSCPISYMWGPCKTQSPELKAGIGANALWTKKIRYKLSKTSMVELGYIFGEFLGRPGFTMRIKQQES